MLEMGEWKNGIPILTSTQQRSWLKVSIALPRCLLEEWRGHLQSGKSNTGTGSRGLVHLTENQGDLGLSIKLDNLGLLHFVVQIVTLTSTLTNT